AFHLGMDATDLRVDARRLRAFREDVVLALPLRPGAQVVFLVVRREDVVSRWVAVQKLHGRADDNWEHVRQELELALVHVGGLARRERAWSLLNVDDRVGARRRPGHLDGPRNAAA